MNLILAIVLAHGEVFISSKGTPYPGFYKYSGAFTSCFEARMALYSWYEPENIKKFECLDIFKLNFDTGERYEIKD